MPKFSHILCTVNTTGLIDLLVKFNRGTRDCMARNLGVALEERAWQQAKLPVAMGGMGTRGAEDHAPVA